MNLNGSRISKFCDLNISSNYEMNEERRQFLAEQTTLVVTARVIGLMIYVSLFMWYAYKRYKIETSDHKPQNESEELKLKQAKGENFQLLCNLLVIISVTVYSLVAKDTSSALYIQHSELGTWPDAHTPLEGVKRNLTRMQQLQASTPSLPVA